MHLFLSPLPEGWPNAFHVQTSRFAASWAQTRIMFHFKNVNFTFLMSGWWPKWVSNIREDVMFWKSSTTSSSWINDLWWWVKDANIILFESCYFKEGKEHVYMKLQIFLDADYAFFFNFHCCTLYMSYVNLLQWNPVIQGDSSISWLISLMPGLSLVILRQIIQDYDLTGSVKSVGRHWGASLNMLFMHNSWPKLYIQRECLTHESSAHHTLRVQIHI